MSRYSMIVQWSNEDQLFLVTIPEFAERVVMPCTYGKTRANKFSKNFSTVAAFCNASSIFSEFGTASPTKRGYSGIIAGNNS